MSPPSTPGEVSWAPAIAWLDSSPRPPTSGNVIPAMRRPAITVTASSRTFAVIDPRPARSGHHPRRHRSVAPPSVPARREALVRGRCRVPHRNPGAPRASPPHGQFVHPVDGHRVGAPPSLLVVTEAHFMGTWGFSRPGRGWSIEDGSSSPPATTARKPGREDPVFPHLLVGLVALRGRPRRHDDGPGPPRPDAARPAPRAHPPSSPGRSYRPATPLDRAP